MRASDIAAPAVIDAVGDSAITPARRPSVVSGSPWMTLAEAAAYLRRGRRFVLAEIHAGRLRAARIGGRGEILSNRAWCDAYVEAQAAIVVVAPRAFAGGRRGRS